MMAIAVEAFAVIELWRRNHDGDCRGDARVSKLWRRSLGVCVNDLVLLAFAEEVSA